MIRRPPRSTRTDTLFPYTTLFRAVAAAARARRVLVNVVDRAELSDFIVPAIVDRGDITIGIASNGTAPLLLGRIRAQIERLLPARLSELAVLAGEARDTVSSEIGRAHV